MIHTNRRTRRFVDPQIRLADALANRNIEEFRCALKNAADPLALDDENLCVYEKALQTSGASQFVEECLKAGCDPNHINSYYNKAAINFAIDSKDPENLKILLSKPGVQLGHLHETISPLFINITDFYIVPNCVKVLLEYAACINKTKQIEMMPLFNFVKTLEQHSRGTSFLVEELLKVPNINIDADGNGELRQILGKAYPAIRLPAISQSTAITFYTLLNCLRDNDMEMFVQQYTNETRYTTKKGDSELFAESIKRRANRAFDVMLEKGVDMDKLLVEGKFPLEIACIFGNSYALDKLLKRTYIKTCSNEMFHEILCKLNDENYCKQFDDYWNCFYMLLDSDKVNIYEDHQFRPTPLNVAVKYNNKRAILELLKRGVFLNPLYKCMEKPLKRIRPSILEEHLDYCISSNELIHAYDHKDYEITINFENFISPNPKEPLCEVLQPIAVMAESKKYHYLLKHPVIDSILYLKWQKFSTIFYINFACFLFFALSMATFTALRFRASEYEVAMQIAQVCSWLGIFFLMIREFVQICLSPRNYLSTSTNYLEIMLIFCSIVTSCGDIPIMPRDWQRNIGVICILLSAFELILVAGALPFPSISMHILMLKAVCKSFLNIFLLYSIFIVTFTLCFYIKGTEITPQKSNCTEGDSNGLLQQKTNFTEEEKGDDDDSEKAFNNFSKLWPTLVKIIVMFIGELDASSIQLSNYWLFVPFIFFMTVVLFNLLNGLAVSDTQAIKNEAELNEVIYRLDLLRRFEQIIMRNIIDYLVKSRIFYKQSKEMLEKIYSKYAIGTQVTIRPNDYNRILLSKNISEPNHDNVEPNHYKEEPNHDKVEPFIPDYETGSVKKCVRNADSMFCCPNKRLKYTIDREIVAKAIAVLQKKSMPTDENQQEEKINKILEFLLQKNAWGPENF